MDEDAAADRGHVEPGGPTLTRRAESSGRQIDVRKLSVGAMDNNCYVIIDVATGEALLIDAADDAERILSEVADLSVQAILTTHGHADHWQALGPVAAATGAPLHLHPADASRVPPAADVPAEHGNVIGFGEAQATVLHTPGHTPGSVCLLLDGPEPWLFTGDTLFPGGPGATFGDATAFEEIMRSLRRELFALPDTTQVCPGHGDDTALGLERPHLDEWQARGW